jgi:hypothetical protein
MKTQKLKTLPRRNERLIGRGILTWIKSERVSDRYGTCWLMTEGDNSLSGSFTRAEMWFPPDGEYGTLIALMLKPIESTHVGDFFRGLSPRTPNTGDIIVLGNGAAFKELQCDGIVAVGIKPDDGRESDWLNPRALYDVHESLVELIWIPREVLEAA